MDEAGSSSNNVGSSGNPDYVEVIFVRNGETACGIDERFESLQGDLNVELNDNGRRQALAVADRLSWNPIACIYSSDLNSAVETAHIISRRCGGAEVIEDPDLRDILFGDRQGLVPLEFAPVTPGQQDVELTENGRRQAIDVASRLYWTRRRTACIYTSDLKRAVETAQFISSFCNGAEVIEDPDLRDIHFGVLQDLVPSESVTFRPDAYKAFISNSRSQEFPGGGESIDQFSQRCTSCLQRIVQKHKGKQIIVVTHWSVIAAFYERCGTTNGFPDEKTLNTSVSIFLVADGGEWILKQWNNVNHLNPEGIILLDGL